VLSVQPLVNRRSEGWSRGQSLAETDISAATSRGGLEPVPCASRLARRIARMVRCQYLHPRPDRSRPVFFTFPEDARWNAGWQAVEFGVEIGEFAGVVRVPQRVFQRLLRERPRPARCVEAYYYSGPGFESIAGRKIRRRQLTEDGNVEISGRDLRSGLRPTTKTRRRTAPRFSYTRLPAHNNAIPRRERREPLFCRRTGLSRGHATG
jgi:hypothetical protein